MGAHGRILMAVVVGCLAAGLWAAQEPAEKPAETPEEKKIVELPGLRLDREKRVLDVEATVIRREGDWLELLACTPGTREHEAILTVPARPSHINLALIMMGLEPGTPMKTVIVDGKYHAVPPHGPLVAVWLVVTDEKGEQKEVPANEWIFDRDSQKPMKGNHWMFTGSSIYEHEGQQIFLADVNGTVLSLVQFGDDLLARETDLTSRSDGEILAANTEAIPAVGTKVLIRMRPVEEKKDDEAGKTNKQ